MPQDSATVKLCKDCAYCHSYEVATYCSCPSIAPADLVYGGRRLTVMCYDAREGQCGHDAAYFVPPKVDHAAS